MLTLTTVLTLNSRYEALTIDGSVLAVRQAHGTYLRDVTDAGWLALNGKHTAPHVGQSWTFHPVKAQSVTTSKIQCVESRAADVNLPALLTTL